VHNLWRDIELISNFVEVESNASYVERGGCQFCIE
jgi:hypothetical protein